MYKSPIHMYLTDIQKQLNDSIEEQAYQCIKNVGIVVDKDELIRALQYDRQQYEKGYADAQVEIIRCKDCEHYNLMTTRFDVFGINAKRRCNHPKIYCSDSFESTWLDMPEDGFCSYAERKGPNTAESGENNWPEWRSQVLGEWKGGQDE